MRKEREGAMKPCFTTLLALSAAAAVIVAGLSGCGRRGAPELPASAYMQNDKGRQVKKPAPDKPFILDKLIQ